MNTQTTALPTVSDYISSHAENAPNDLALIFDSTKITYQELDAHVRQWAKALIAAGVRPGERVAFCGGPRPEFVFSYLAVGAIGAVWQGVNPDYSERELEYVLTDAQPVIVFSQPPASATGARERLEAAAKGAGLAVPIAVESPEMTEFLSAGTDISYDSLAARHAAVSSQDPAMIVYTSGSTGAPKGALLRHSGLVRLGAVQSSKWDTESPVVMCNLPINHIGCVGDLCSVPLIAGGTVVLRERFDAQEVLEDIDRYGITALFQVATQLQRVASLPDFDTRELPSLAVVGWGGSPLPQVTIEKYRAKGCRLMSTYGLTEATFSVSYTDEGANDDVLMNTVGKPDPDIDVRLLGENGDWVELGEHGEVCIRHEGTMASYLNRPEATAAAYTPGGWLRTGDIGYVREDGNLVLVSRVSEMFKSGGLNVYPREIEQILEEHPEIELAAVVSRPDPEFQEVGVAYVQPIAGATIDPADLKSWLRDRLAGYKTPKNIVIEQSIPLLPVGKVNKAQLKRLAHETAREK
ncbi:MAG: long-chain fatty acid--CoA ligase [Aeromicrobium sp.]|nr:MAG: long-chain fatty acid--CoA ligase [Aeromicrobium sp.]